jgi:hypothetical protein
MPFPRIGIFKDLMHLFRVGGSIFLLLLFLRLGPSRHREVFRSLFVHETHPGGRYYTLPGPYLLIHFIRTNIQKS